MIEMSSLRGSLSSLLLVVAFFVGNSECHLTSREKRSQYSDDLKICKEKDMMDCLLKLQMLKLDILNLERKIEGTEIVDNFFTLRLPDLQR